MPVALLTCNPRYGALGSHPVHHSRGSQLANGQLLSVPPALVVRCKQHFVTLECGVDAILGKNGNIWLSGAVLWAACNRAWRARLTARLSRLQKPFRSTRSQRRTHQVLPDWLSLWRRPRSTRLLACVVHLCQSCDCCAVYATDLAPVHRARASARGRRWHESETQYVPSSTCWFRCASTQRNACQHRTCGSLYAGDGCYLAVLRQAPVHRDLPGDHHERRP